jgi:hypothetical protein
MAILIAMLIAFCAVFIGWITPMRFATGTADYSAEILVEPEQTTVAIALVVSSPIGMAEYSREITVRNGRGLTATHRLVEDHGGFPAVSLYRREDGKLVIASSLDGALEIDVEAPKIMPIRPVKRDDRFRCGDFRPIETVKTLGPWPESKYIAGYFYVGRFDFLSRGNWVFIAPSRETEYLRPTGVGDFWDPGCGS